MRATSVSVMTGGRFNCITKIAIEARDADGRPEVLSVASSGYDPSADDERPVARWRAGHYIAAFHVRALKHECSASSGTPITQILPSMAVPTVRRETVTPWGQTRVEQVPVNDPSVARGGDGEGAGEDAGEPGLAPLTVVRESGMASSGPGGGTRSYYLPADGGPPQVERGGGDGGGGADALAAGVVAEPAAPPSDVLLRYPVPAFPDARPFAALAACSEGDHLNSPEPVLAAGGRLTAVRAFVSPRTGCIEALHQTYRAAGLEQPVVLKAGSDGPMVRCGLGEGAGDEDSQQGGAAACRRGHPTPPLHPPPLPARVPPRGQRQRDPA
jgi:hypothetical protein